MPLNTRSLDNVVAKGARNSNEVMPLKNVFSTPKVYLLTDTPPAAKGTSLK